MTMKIKRMVDGIEREFYLTEQELEDAHEIVRHKCFVEYIASFNKYNWSDNEIDRIAGDAMFLVDMYGYSDTYASDIAIEKYNEEHGIEEEMFHDDYADYQWGC